MGAEGASVLTSPPPSDERGLVVRVAGPVETTGGGGGAIPITDAVRTSVPAVVADTPILAANPNRRSGYVYNASATATLYLAYGGVAASPTNYTAALGPGDGFPIGPNNATFAVRGYWDIADGAAKVTEMTGGSVVDPITAANRTQVPQNAADVLILAANASRRAGYVFNDATSTEILYLAYGAAPATTADYTVALNPGEGFPIEDDATFEIRGIWGGAGPGFAAVTEEQ